MTFWKWSRTASANATADSTCPFPEGMAPSAVNDGVRGAMAAVAKYRDDIAGAITTAGTSTAYTLFSYQGFDSLAHMDGAMIAFTPHTANGATVTLNVDGLGARPLRFSPSFELPSNSLVVGTPYVATYFNATTEWILHGAQASSPYNIPLAGGIDYWDTTAPNSSFAFPLGQALSRTTYATLFAKFGTTYGAGDGSTTFNIPDKGERVSVMKAGTASRLSSTYFGGNSTLMGATGGADHTSQTIAQANLPSVNFALSISLPQYAVPNESGAAALNHGDDQFAAMGPSGGNVGPAQSLKANPIGSATGTAASGGSGTALQLSSVQPTIVCNYIMRII
jgi:microcystin-dependent protein